MAEENIKVPVETLVDFTIEALTAMGTSGANHCGVLARAALEGKP